MDINPYAAPSSPVDITEEQAPQRFYVVAPIKFLVLFFVTIGMYQIYWVYKHWSQFKKSTRGDQWPVMRAIFAVFFTHSLFVEINHSLNTNKVKYQWNSGVHATFTVIFLVIGNIMDRLSMKEIGSPITDLLSILVVPIIGFFLYRAQCAANHACGDPKGDTNKNFTVANIIWIVIGLIWSAMVALGLFMSFFPEQFPE
jgi:hypothetical protein